MTQPLQVDGRQLHLGRLERARQMMRQRGLAAALLFDTMNVRYVSFPERVMPVFSMHHSTRWVLLPVESAPILWEYPGFFVSVPSYWTGETRPINSFTFFDSGPDTERDAKIFAEEIAGVLRERGLLGEPLGVDRLETVAFLALWDAGVRLVDAHPTIELARAVKTADELDILRANAKTCDEALAVMVDAMRPGMTEHQIWSTFIGAAIGRGAEWCETRMLASGPRTNPWMQEATHRVVEAGDLLGIDTDLVGQFGYLTDVSRTYLIGDGPATDEQRRLFSVAYEYVYENIPELRPGLSFRELGEKLGKRFPEEFRELRYPFVAHGAGMIDEYPGIKFDNHHDGEIEAGMCLSVEAYVGVSGGKEGVKLEEQIIITDTGNEIISRAPYDERLRP